MSKHDDVIIDLAAANVIDLADEPDPTLVEIANSPAVAGRSSRFFERDASSSAATRGGDTGTSPG